MDKQVFQMLRRSHSEPADRPAGRAPATKGRRCSVPNGAALNDGAILEREVELVGEKQSLSILPE
jgi:hypothetical protein